MALGLFNIILFAISDLILVSLNKENRTINHSSIYVRIILLILIIQIYLIWTSYNTQFISVMDAYIPIKNIYIILRFLCVSVLIFIYIILYIRLIKNKRLVTEVLLIIIIASIGIFLFNKFVINTLISEINIKISNYKIIGIIALAIPMIKSTISYCRKELNGIQNSRLKYDYLSYFAEEGPSIESGKISYTFLSHFMNKSAKYTKRDLRFSWIYLLIKSFIIIYISIPLIMLGVWNNVKDDKALAIRSIEMSVITLLLTFFIFNFIRMMIHKIYNFNYHPLSIIFEYSKCFADIFKNMIFIILLMFRMAVGSAVFTVIRITFVIYMKIKINEHSDKYYKLNLISILTFLLVYNKEAAKIFVQLWALSKYNHRLGIYTINKEYLMTILRRNNVKYNYGKINENINYLIEHDVIESFRISDKNVSYFCVLPKVNWTNIDARKYVLSNKDSADVSAGFKGLIRKINK